MKANRFACFWIPPFCVLSVHVFSLEPKKNIIKYIMNGMLLLICCYNVINTYQRNSPFISGCKEAVESAIQDSKGNCILLSANPLIDGNFAFYLRKYDAEKKYYLLRADKILGTYSEGNIEDLFNKIGVTTLVVETRDNVIVPEASMFRKLIKAQKLKLRKKVKVACNDLPIYQFPNMALLIYEYTDARNVALGGDVYIPIPKIGKTIKLKFKK
jgi:hypothetical protein